MGIDISAVNKAKKKEGTLKSPSPSIFSILPNFRKLSTLSNKDKEAFYKDLATVLHAGVDFKSSLEILTNQQKKKSIKSLIVNIEKQIVKGRTFHEALQHTGQFSAFETSSIKIGEETKKLDEVLLELHGYFNRKIKLRRQIVSVATYPVFVLVLTFGVFYFMLNYVVPMFKSVFNQFGAELPSLTKKILLLSENFSTIILSLAIFCLVLGVFVRIYGKNSKFRSLFSKILLKVPYFGNLVKYINLARFCQFLNLLLTAKTSLPESLDMVKGMIGFYPIEASIDVIGKDILRGSSLSNAMRKHSIYENKLISMVSVAEEINELDTMFGRLAEEYNEEVEHKTKMLGVVMEPLIIVFIGAIVGIVMVAMYAPMFDLSKIINGA